MPDTPAVEQLVVAISSRALFDFEEENKVFETADDRSYMRLQLDRIEQPAKPGVAYRLVRKLEAFNADGVKRVDVVILSRNDPVSGLRVFKSVEKASLVDRARRVHARPRAVRLPRGAQGQPLPLGQRRRRARRAQRGLPGRARLHAAVARGPASRGSAHRVRRRRGALRRRGRARLPDRGPRRVPEARVRPRDAAAAAGPVQAAAGGAAPAAARRRTTATCR